MRKIGIIILSLLMCFTFISCGKEDVVTVKDGEFNYDVHDYLKDMNIKEDDVYFADNIAFQYEVSADLAIVGQINEDNDNLIGVVFVINSENSDKQVIEDVKTYLGKTIKCLNINIDNDEIFNKLDLDNTSLESTNSVTKENLDISFQNTEESILLTLKGKE